MDTPRWFCCLALLSAISLSACGASTDDSSSSSDPQPEVTALVPDANEVSVPLNSTIQATFTETMAAADRTSFVVHGFFTGKILAGTYSGGSTTTLEFDPVSDFKPGEEIEVSLTDSLSSGAGRPAVPYVYRFRTAVGGGSGTFSLSAPVAGQNGASDVAAGDWDGDGDLDLAVANRSANSIACLLYTSDAADE